MLPNNPVGAPQNTRDKERLNKEHINYCSQVDVPCVYGRAGFLLANRILGLDTASHPSSEVAYSHRLNCNTKTYSHAKPPKQRVPTTFVPMDRTMPESGTNLKLAKTVSTDSLKTCVQHAPTTEGSRAGRQQPGAPRLVIDFAKMRRVRSTPMLVPTASSAADSEACKIAPLSNALPPKPKPKPNFDAHRAHRPEPYRDLNVDIPPTGLTPKGARVDRSYIAAPGQAVASKLPKFGSTLNQRNMVGTPLTQQGAEPTLFNFNQQRPASAMEKFNPQRRLFQGGHNGRADDPIYVKPTFGAPSRNAFGMGGSGNRH